MKNYFNFNLVATFYAIAIGLCKGPFEKCAWGKMTPPFPVARFLTHYQHHPAFIVNTAKKSIVRVSAKQETYVKLAAL